MPPDPVPPHIAAMLDVIWSGWRRCNDVTQAYYIAVAKDAFAAAEAALWRPIEEAKANEQLLLFCPERGITNPRRIELDFAAHGSSNEVANNMSYHSWATHFRPLPAGPEKE